MMTAPFLLWMHFSLALMVLHSAYAHGHTYQAQFQQPPIMDYWRKWLPSAAMPASLKDKVSPLSAAQVGTFKQMIESGQLLSNPTAASAFCSAADLLCGSKLNDKVVSRSLALMNSDDPDGGRHFYYYQNSLLQTQQAASAGADSTNLKKGHSWFLEKDLTTGLGTGAAFQVPAGQFYNRLHQATQRSFLPRELANLLGLELPNILHQLRITASSSFGRVMRETAGLCAIANSSDPTSACVTSLEDLVDHVAKILYRGCGRAPIEIQALSSNGLHPSEYNLLQDNWFTVSKVEQKADERSMYLSCHSLLFPFQATLCHHVPATRVFSVTLETTVKGLKFTLTNTVLCHKDTSKWSPDHVAFKVLGTTPGKTEACHWSFNDEFVFVPDCP